MLRLLCYIYILVVLLCIFKLYLLDNYETMLIFAVFFSGYLCKCNVHFYAPIITIYLFKNDYIVFYDIKFD